MIRCPNCGAEYNDNTWFCVKCGTMLDAEKDKVATEVEEAPEELVAEEEPMASEEPAAEEEPEAPEEPAAEETVEAEEEPEEEEAVEEPEEEEPAEEEEEAEAEEEPETEEESEPEEEIEETVEQVDETEPEEEAEPEEELEETAEEVEETEPEEEEAEEEEEPEAEEEPEPEGPELMPEEEEVQAIMETTVVPTLIAKSEEAEKDSYSSYAGGSVNVDYVQADSDNNTAYGNVSQYRNGNYKEDKVYDSGSIGWAILGFFLPLIGLILFLAWHNSKPNSAKAAGLGALVSVIVNFVLSIISFLVLGIGSAFVSSNNLVNIETIVNGVASVISSLIR